MKRFVSKEISAPGLRDGAFSRADLEFYGVDHSGPSFEARIFLNNPGANPETPTDLGDGYVGSFHIFGHGGCFGDAGHCDVPDAPLHQFDNRLPHQLLPQKKVVIITEGLREVSAASRGTKITVTVVPLVRSVVLDDLDTEDVLRFDRLALVTYD
jgi:hypothetical protein